jgi:serine/threonine protein kinase
MALSAGIKLGPYEIQSLIGAGGMGEVYRAHDARLDRTVAIKVLPISYSADRDRLQRFAQEARSAAALNHPNILSIFDIGDTRGAPYVVSELLEGDSPRLTETWPAIAPKSHRLCIAGRARIGSRAREGHRPSRPETRKPVHHQ